MFGLKEIGLIFVMIFLLFGASVLPKFAKSLGQAREELKKGFEQSNPNQ